MHEIKSIGAICRGSSHAVFKKKKVKKAYYVLWLLVLPCDSVTSIKEKKHDIL